MRGRHRISAAAEQRQGRRNQRILLRKAEWFVASMEDGTETSHPDAASNHNLNKACESCRNSKLRCVVDDDSPDGSCKRCITARRACKFKAPRARQRRKVHVDTRVAMLERQLRSLKIQLELAQRWNVEKDSDVTVDTSAESKSVFNSRRGQLRFEAPVTPASWPKKSAIPAQEGPQSLTKSSTEAVDEPIQGINGNRESTVDDVVSRKVVSWQTAEHLVRLYLSDFAPRYPFVTLPSYLSAEHLRRHRPATFLAIITAASAMSTPEENAALTKELLMLVARRVILDGENTLDLAQAMIVLTMWYSTLDRFHSFRYYQLAHLAATIATDLDSERKHRETEGGGLTDDDIEYLRTALSIYLLCSGTSITSGRPKMLQFTDDYISDNLTLLESHQNGKDQWFIAWVKLQHLAEKAVEAFCSGHQSFDISETRNQLMVVEYCQKLDLWRMDLGFELEGEYSLIFLLTMSVSRLMITTGSLSIHYHYVRSVVLCVCIYVDHGISNFRPPFHIQAIDANLPPSPPLTPFVTRTVMALIETIHTGLDAFLSFDIWMLQSSPVIYYIRAAYNLTILLTLDMAVRRPGNELAKIVDPDMLKIERYFHAFKMGLPSSTEHEGRHNPEKFLIIVERMEAWWRSQIQTDPQNTDVSRPLTVFTNDHAGSMQHKVVKVNERSSFERFQSTSISRPSDSPVIFGIDRMYEQQVLGAIDGPPGSDHGDLLTEDWIFDMGQDPARMLAPEIDWTYLDDQYNFG